MRAKRAAFYQSPTRRKGMWPLYMTPQLTAAWDLGEEMTTLAEGYKGMRAMTRVQYSPFKEACLTPICPANVAAYGRLMP